MEKVEFSIIIPTWNGKKLLQKNLPKVVEAVSDQKAEIIVVDDGSTDGTAAYLKNLKPKSSMIRIIRLKENQGFASACNLGVKNSSGKIVVLLNNDVIPEKGFLKPLQKDLSDPKVFAVSCNEVGGKWGGPPRANFENGFLHYTPGKKTKKTVHSLWASGGSAAFDRKTWFKLGGFDLLFSPFYWEDIDLSYRAWKRGYRVLWEPESRVSHRHESTISRLSESYVSLIKQRNELLFLWKNITSPKLILEHKKFLLKRAIKHPGYFRVVLSALVKLPQVLARRREGRREGRKQAQLTDRQILSYQRCEYISTSKVG
jgi:GT2 family glycosyltransferase